MKEGIIHYQPIDTVDDLAEQWMWGFRERLVVRGANGSL
jgi:hypothetical protein